VQNELEMAPDLDGNSWNACIRQLILLSSSNSVVLHFLGVGNPIKCDDSVGLVIASRLRKKCGYKAQRFAMIHPPVLHSKAESLLRRISESAEQAVIFDAVEASLDPGAIVFENMAKTQFGFFASHNVPLRLIPGLNLSSIYLLGVQPKKVDVGEDLSEEVKESADVIVEELCRILLTVKA
jgi:hydrogenase 3 maturation protease